MKEHPPFAGKGAEWVLAPNKKINLGINWEGGYFFTRLVFIVCFCKEVLK